MEVLWTLSHRRLRPKKQMLRTGHHMVVVLLLSSLTLYTDATRCRQATSIRCASCGKLRFYHTIIHCRFRTTVSFAEQSTRRLSGESHGKALVSLTVDRDPTMRLCGWKIHTKSGIGTLDYSSRACWRILSFMASLIMPHFDSIGLMATDNTKALCQAIGLGNRRLVILSSAVHSLLKYPPGYNFTGSQHIWCNVCPSHSWER